MTEDEAIALAWSIRGGGLNKEEGTFLYRLALDAPKGEMFVELGTGQGMSAAILCAAAKETNSRVITIDHSADDGAEETLRNLGIDARVVIGDSAVIPDGIDRIGLLFIDTKHTRKRLYKELDAWLPLLMEGGILAFHDYGSYQEMEPAIDERIRDKTDEWEYLGLARWMIGFRRLS